MVIPIFDRFRFDFGEKLRFRFDFRRQLNGVIKFSEPHGSGNNNYCSTLAHRVRARCHDVCVWSPCEISRASVRQTIAWATGVHEGYACW